MPDSARVDHGLACMQLDPVLLAVNLLDEGCRTRRAHARPGRAGRWGPGRLAVDDQQAQPVQTVQSRAQRRELARVELAWPVGWYPGQDRGAFGEYLREGGDGGQDGCGPGAAGSRVMDVRGGVHAAVRASVGSHVLRMPEPAPGHQDRVLAAATGP
jgi:hypothetical protein